MKVSDSVTSVSSVSNSVGGVALWPSVAASSASSSRSSNLLSTSNKSCSIWTSSCSKSASRSRTILRILFRFDILLSISRISDEHMFFLTPIISSRWSSLCLSFFVFAKGVPSSFSSMLSSSFWPLAFCRLCRFLCSLSPSLSGSVAWKPWNRE